MSSSCAVTLQSANRRLSFGGSGSGVGLHVRVVGREVPSIRLSGGGIRAPL